MKLHPALRVLLWPLALVFEGIVRLRARLYRHGILRQKRLKGVVISVGNLTVGGTGKTPMVFTLAQHLHDRGKRIGILSRGYKGKVKTDENVPPPADSSVILSDETWMMERHFHGRVTLGVGADRFAHGRKLEQQGIEWFILDDGFQHLSLARDVDIVLIDATDPFGGNWVLPSGGLREPKSALARADVVVITRSTHAPALETIVRKHTPAPLFYAQTDLKEIVPGGHSLVPGEPGAWLGRKFYVFCAIGNSRAFFADVRNWGMEIVGQQAFPDHHHYSREGCAAIEGQARTAGAEALLCTDKDTYNLDALTFQELPLYVCRIRMNVSEEKKFWQTLYDIIERRRGGAAR